MRIGIDVTPLTPARSGVGYYTYYLLDQLLRDGAGMEYHALSTGRGAPDLTGLAGLAARRHVALPTRAVYALWAAIGRPRADTLLGGVDVFHATNYVLPPVASARTVLTIYDLSFLRHPELCSPKIVGPFSRRVPRFAKRADAVLTCSEASKRDIVELLGVAPEKVCVAHGAANAGLAPMPREEAEARLAPHGIAPPYLLFTGTLEPRKNVAGLIRAFDLAAPRIPHTLVLVGQWGWKTEDIQAALAEARHRDRIVVAGYLPGHNTLAAAYSAADVFVLPSFYEGFGLPVLEAMACGAPVITSRRASLPEVGGDAACYVAPDDTEALAHEIEEVASDAARRDAMRTRGFAQAKRFTWEACAARTRGVYRGLA